MAPPGAPDRSLVACVRAYVPAPTTAPAGFGGTGVMAHLGHAEMTRDDHLTRSPVRGCSRHIKDPRQRRSGPGTRSDLSGDLVLGMRCPCGERRPDRLVLRGCPAPGAARLSG